MPSKRTEIQPDQWYNLQEVKELNLLPWCRSFWAVRNVINKDFHGPNILKANITGQGRATKYHIKGINIIRFIKAWESGSPL